MWICSTCGEPHQDQFKECWKCVGAEMEAGEQVTAEPPRPTLSPPERRLRTAGAILRRGAVGFVLGAVLSLSSLNLVNPRTILPGPELSPTAKTVFALVVGAVFGIVVSVFFWVLFPYEAAEGPKNEADGQPSSTDQAH